MAIIAPPQLVFGAAPGYDPSAADAQARIMTVLLIDATINGSCRWRQIPGRLGLRGMYGDTMRVSIDGAPVQLHVSQQGREGRYNLTRAELVKLMALAYSQIAERTRA